jgi:hypothetical protein
MRYFSESSGLNRTSILASKSSLYSRIVPTITPVAGGEAGGDRANMLAGDPNRDETAV